MQAGRAVHKADQTAEELNRAKRQVEYLTLACQSMWELLREHNGLTDEALKEKMLEVDGRDGRTDGKIATQSMDCPKCGAKTHSRRRLCVMCGEPVVRAHVFE